MLQSLTILFPFVCSSSYFACAHYETAGHVISHFLRFSLLPPHSSTHLSAPDQVPPEAKQDDKMHFCKSRIIYETLYHYSTIQKLPVEHRHFPHVLSVPAVYTRWVPVCPVTTNTLHVQTTSTLITCSSVLVCASFLSLCFITLQFTHFY